MLLYNHLLIKNKLVKYEEIQEGDKIKFIVLKEPNPLREKVISFPSTLPKEFNLHKFVNYDEQFDKSFLEPLRFIVNAINWNFEKQATLDGFFFNMLENYDKSLYDRLIAAAREDKLVILDSKSFEKLNEEYNKDVFRETLSEYIANENPVFPLKPILAKMT